MLKCVKCGNQLTIGASDCPRCGYVIGSDRPRPTSPSNVVVLTLGCAVLLNVIVPVGARLAEALIPSSLVSQLSPGMFLAVRDGVGLAIAFIVVAALLSLARVRGRLPHPVPGQCLVIAGLVLVFASSLRWYINTWDDSFARAVVGALSALGALPLWAGRLLILVGIGMAGWAASTRRILGERPDPKGV